MKYIHIAWVALISRFIWLIEAKFFYPKLAAAYRSLRLDQSAAGGGLTIFDVGANKGQSVKFFRKTFFDPKIYAFEPSAKSYAALLKYIKSLKSSTISAYQVGLGNTETTMDFFESVLSETSTFSPPDPGSGYLKRKNRILFLRSGKAFVKTSTHITTLDNFIQQHNLSRIDILKIDVEGFELQVIQGAVKILRSGMVGIVQFERHVDDMRQDTYPVIQELLSSLNFRKLREIKHPIGNFYEVLYQSNNSSFLTNE